MAFDDKSSGVESLIYHVLATTCSDENAGEFCFNITALLSIGKKVLVAVKSQEQANLFMTLIKRSVTEAQWDNCRFVHYSLLTQNYAKNGVGAEYSGPFIEMEN